MCDVCGYPGDTHYVEGVAYPANRVDGHDEFMTTDNVRKSMWTFMDQTMGQQIGLHHADGTVGHGMVRACYQWPEGAPDWVTTAADGSTQVVKSGDWVLGVEFDAETWPRIRRGEFNGWSIQGMGARRESEAPQ
jgi:hypothetical protein